MVKSIIKETFIILLLLVLIILVFGIAFYNYIPIMKVVPDKVAYTISEEVKTELETDVSVEEIRPEPITYSVTSKDLKQYEANGPYQKGNPNPFQAYSSGNNNSTIIERNNVIENNTTHYYPTNSSSK